MRPRRPRWGQLYVALVTVGTAGAATHFMAPRPTLVRIADVGCGLGMFGVLAIWMRLNRIALTRLDEPEVGIDRPHVRIVRSRKQAPFHLDPEERIVLPYVFR